jgi:hypothetical protein
MIAPFYRDLRRTGRRHFRRRRPTDYRRAGVARSVAARFEIPSRDGPKAGSNATRLFVPPSQKSQPNFSGSAPRRFILVRGFSFVSLKGSFWHKNTKAIEQFLQRYLAVFDSAK